jgi:drug/metabolite transporter (DMT)-like permease
MASGDPQKSGIYRLIRIVAALDFLGGVAFIIFGPSLLGTNDFFNLGLGLAIIGAFIFAFFTLLAARASRR